MTWTKAETLENTWTKDTGELPFWFSQFLLLSDGTFLLQVDEEQGIILGEDLEIAEAVSVWTKEDPL